LFGFKIFNIYRWVRGRRTLEFFHEFVEIGMEFNNLATELVLEVVHFCMNSHNFPIYLGLKGSKVSTKFLIGFFLESGGNHEWMMGGSVEGS
jgi:hypothetical protein